MSTSATFQLVYDGEGVRSGSMDVHELAPALMAMGDLLKVANDTLNGDRASVSCRVESDFKRSSFEISLIVDQGLLESAKNLLLGSSGADASRLLTILFGGTSVAAITTGIITIYKALKGEKPLSVTVNLATNLSLIETRSGQSLKDVDNYSAQIYDCDAARDALRRIVKPVQDPGITEMRVQKGSQTLETVSKEDAAMFSAPLSDTGEPVREISNIREAYLRVDKLSFVPGQSWRFSDGSAKFYAKIEDRAFQRGLDERREGFFSGDILRVKLRTTQRADAKTQIPKTEYFIDHVIQHLPAPQQKLPLGPPRE